MQIRPLKILGTYEITLNRIGDERGYFTEIYSQKAFEENGLTYSWVQENQSLSVNKDTIRGLHFQMPPMAQAKLVRAVEGEILDVFVDLRKSSPDYGQWDSIRLSAENCKWVLIPRGFAHGFRTLCENTIVQYKVDNYYSKAHDAGIRWNDPDIGIDWQTDDGIISTKDREAQFYGDFVSPF